GDCEQIPLRCARASGCSPVGVSQASDAVLSSRNNRWCETRRASHNQATLYWPLICSIRAYLSAAFRRGCPAIFLGLHVALRAWRSPDATDGSPPPVPPGCV